MLLVNSYFGLPNGQFVSAGRFERPMIAVQQRVRTFQQLPVKLQLPVTEIYIHDPWLEVEVELIKGMEWFENGFFLRAIIEDESNRLYRLRRKGEHAIAGAALLLRAPTAIDPAKYMCMQHRVFGLHAHAYVAGVLKTLFCQRKVVAGRSAGIQYNGVVVPLMPGSAGCSFHSGLGIKEKELMIVAEP